MIPDVVPQFAEHEFQAKNFVQPLGTYFTVPSTHDFQGVACETSQLFFICYPTIDPSTLDYYADDAIPGWEDSLLMTALKDGTVYRVDGTDQEQDLGESQPLFTSVNRYRDTAISSDGKTIYVATGMDGLARGEMATPPPCWRTRVRSSSSTAPATTPDLERDLKPRPSGEALRDRRHYACRPAGLRAVWGLEFHARNRGFSWIGHDSAGRGARAGPPWYGAWNVAPTPRP